MTGTSETIELRGRGLAKHVIASAAKQSAPIHDSETKDCFVASLLAMTLRLASSKRTTHDPLRSCFTDLVSRFNCRIQAPFFAFDNAALEEALHYVIIFITIISFEIEFRSLSEPVRFHQVFKE